MRFTDGEESPDKERIRILEAALRKIARWHDEFPQTDRFWDDEHTQPKSYAAAFGSNGERDFMRQVALDALAPPLENFWLDYGAKNE